MAGFMRGSLEPGVGVERVRRVLAALGCTTAEVAALAVLVAGGVAVLGVVWLAARPGAPPGPSPGAAAEAGPAEPGAQAPEAAGELELVEQALVVHVAGEVAEPGLYELAAGARVADAVEAAGGPSDEAVMAGLNLAREVSDGEQLYVPGPQQAAAPRAAGPAAGNGNSPPGGAGRGAAWRPDGRLDLNRATAEDLEELPGIGPVLAERILSRREELGRFDAVGELREVTGIGEKTFQRLAERVVV